MAETSTNNPVGIAGPPPPPGGGVTTSPIGVPAGYKAPLGPNRPFEGLHPGPGTPATLYGTDPRAHQYMPGDQWKVPLSDPQSIPQLQLALIQAGLLNKNSVRLGTWDIGSANAYSSVLGFANAYGLNANQALQVLVSNPKASATTDTYVDPVFTNPQDVETGFQQVSQNLTGQEMPVGDFQTAFHAQEAKEGHTAGKSYTRAPTVQGAATQYVVDKDPSQVLAYGTASRMQELYAMLGIKG